MINYTSNYVRRFNPRLNQVSVEVKESPLHGNGVFSLEDIDFNVSFFTKVLDINLKFNGFNHLDNPNAKMIRYYVNHGMKFLSLKKISKGDEITVFYPGYMGVF